MNKCKKCGAEIEWVEENGKWIPLDIKTKDNHFKNCPFAKHFSGKRTTDKGEQIEKEQTSLQDYTEGG